ncbi:MAG: hopC [Streptomyces oryziradicis]|nr:hopC [Actinacidiphila oryziradicis]
MSDRAVVVGGGLAGTAAALALADAGLTVTLVEGRPRLGGLAFSFKRGDLTVDNGQHVFLRCCTAYQWFLDRISARDLVTIQDRLDVPVLDAGPAAPGAGDPSARRKPATLAAGPDRSGREAADTGRRRTAMPNQPGAAGVGDDGASVPSERRGIAVSGDGLLPDAGLDGSGDERAAAGAGGEPNLRDRPDGIRPAPAGRFRRLLGGGRRGGQGLGALLGGTGGAVLEEASSQAAGRLRLGRLRRAALPVPLHLAASLASYPHLSLLERASVGRAALALRGLDPMDPALDDVDFASWLRERGQSARTIEALWDLVGIATLNATAEHASLGLAAMVFKTGLLSDPGAADIGWASVPLGELHDTRARAALDKAAVRTILRGRATAVTRTAPPTGAPGHDPAPERGLRPETAAGSAAVPSAGARWQVAVETGPGRTELLDADVVVIAVPQREAHELLPEGALEDPGALLKIGTAPILNVHVVYDRKVLRQPFFAAIGSPVQWVFDRTEHSGMKDSPGAENSQYIALSQSAAEDDIDLPVAELREKYLPELERLLPAARGATVKDFFVTRERTATFAPAPGVGRLRPGARTRAPGIYLAGAWTATGWPATMESAVRSGMHAAVAALTTLGRPHDLDFEGVGRESV